MPQEYEQCFSFQRAGLLPSIIRRASAVDDKPDLSSAATAKEEGWQLFEENINNAFLGGVSTAELHGTPESGAPEKYHPPRKRSG